MYVEVRMSRVGFIACFRNPAEIICKNIRETEQKNERAVCRASSGGRDLGVEMSKCYLKMTLNNGHLKMRFFHHNSSSSYDTVSPVEMSRELR